MSEWISIKDFLPTPNIRLWVTDQKVVREASYCSHGGDFIAWPILPLVFIEMRVTHWQPLPPPPKKKRWMPLKDGTGYIICGHGDVELIHCCHPNIFTEWRKTFGIYKSKEEAQSMLDKIKAFVESEIGEA